MKLEALKHQGKRTDLTSDRGGQKLTARERVAQDAGETSGTAVARYISLTKLVPPLLAMVDDEKLAVSTAADYISDLSESQQTDLLTVMGRLDVIPTKGQLAKIKKYSKDGTLNVTVIDAILSEQSPTPVQVTIKKDRLKQYFPATYSAQEIEEVIFALLDTWRAQNAVQQ